MERKLPKVFANNLNEVNNNNSVFYSADNSDRNIENIKPEKELFGKTVEQKINEIFNSPYYIYKADVEITLENDVVTKKIIGKNRSNIITMDNELIPIKSIKDIKYK